MTILLLQTPIGEALIELIAFLDRCTWKDDEFAVA